MGVIVPGVSVCVSACVWGGWGGQSRAMLSCCGSTSEPTWTKLPPRPSRPSGPSQSLCLPPDLTPSYHHHHHNGHTHIINCRSAFKALAYKRYHQVPLYLEWAPAGVFDGALRPATATPAAAATASKAHSGAAATAAAATAGSAGAAPAEAGGAVGGGEEGEEEGEGDAASRAIYVKNLSFATTDKALTKHFDRVVSGAGGRLLSARVARRKGPDGKLLSMGFGFVECDSEGVAKAAIKQLQVRGVCVCGGGAMVRGGACACGTLFCAWWHSMKSDCFQTHFELEFTACI